MDVENQNFYGMTSELTNISWGPLARFTIRLESNMNQINRKTESLLDVVSSCGGLMRALTVFVSILVSPYNKYVLDSLLTLNLVRFVPSKSSNSILKEQKDKKQRESDFK